MLAELSRSLDGKHMTPVQSNHASPFPLKITNMSDPCLSTGPPSLCTSPELCVSTASPGPQRQSPRRSVSRRRGPVVYSCYCHQSTSLSLRHVRKLNLKTKLGTEVMKAVETEQRNACRRDWLREGADPTLLEGALVCSSSSIDSPCPTRGPPPPSP